MLLDYLFIVEIQIKVLTRLPDLIYALLHYISLFDPLQTLPYLRMIICRILLDLVRLASIAVKHLINQLYILLQLFLALISTSRVSLLMALIYANQSSGLSLPSFDKLSIICATTLMLLRLKSKALCIPHLVISRGS